MKGRRDRGRGRRLTGPVKRGECHFFNRGGRRVPAEVIGPRRTEVQIDVAEPETAKVLSQIRRVAPQKVKRFRPFRRDGHDQPRIGWCQREPQPPQFLRMQGDVDRAIR